MSEEEKKDFLTTEKSSPISLESLVNFSSNPSNLQQVVRDWTSQDQEMLKGFDSQKTMFCSPLWQELYNHKTHWPKNAEWVERYSQLRSNFPKYDDIQSQIRDIVSSMPQIPSVSTDSLAPLIRTYDAIGEASLSPSMGDYKQNILTAIEEIKNFSSSLVTNSCISYKSNPLLEQLNELKNIADSAREENLSELQERAASLKCNVDISITQKITDISDKLSLILTIFEGIATKFEKASQKSLETAELLLVLTQKSLDAAKQTQQNVEELVSETQTNNREIKELLTISQKNADTVEKQLATAERNGNTVKELLTSSQNNFDASKVDAKKNKILSYVAISIAIAGIITQVFFSCRAEKNDKTGELVEAFKQSHPWSEQQISAEEAKKFGVAFHVITGALQENIQLKKEHSSLIGELKKAQDDLAELQKKYNATTAELAQEKQKLYAEITALKKQIEELKAELAKRPLAPPVFTQEDKK